MHHINSNYIYGHVQHLPIKTKIYILINNVNVKPESLPTLMVYTGITYLFPIIKVEAKVINFTPTFVQLTFTRAMLYIPHYKPLFTDTV